MRHGDSTGGNEMRGVRLVYVGAALLVVVAVVVFFYLQTDLYGVSSFGRSVHG